MRSLYTAAAGMAAQQFNLDVIANNLANVNTTGFKQSRAEFQDMVYQLMRSSGTQSGAGINSPSALEVGLGARIVATTSQFEQGALQTSTNKFDMAIQGDGFFKVQLADGTFAYSRDGSFKPDATGRLVTSDGFPIQPEFLVPTDAVSFTIGTEGTVQIQRAGSATVESLGQVLLTKFPNPAGLEAVGRNLYKETAASGTGTDVAPGSQGVGSITQYALENSNVQIVEEMVKMILAQRAYEINSKAIQTADDMLGTTNNIKR